MNETNPTPTQQGETLLPCPFCGVKMIRSGLDQPHFQQWWEHEDRETSKCVLKNQTISDASKVYKVAWNTRRAAVAGPRGDAALNLLDRLAVRVCLELRDTDPGLLSHPAWKGLIDEANALLKDHPQGAAATSSPAPADVPKVRGNHFSDAAIDKGFPDHISRDGSAYYNDGTVLRSAAPTPAERTHEIFDAGFAAAPADNDAESLLQHVAYIRERRDYFASKDLQNGWSGRESGPCCERCVLLPEHFTGRADALKALAGCRNPFQLPEVCQCHIPVREAVRTGIVEAHNQLLRRLGTTATTTKEDR